MPRKFLNTLQLFIKWPLFTFFKKMSSSERIFFTTRTCKSYFYKMLYRVISLLHSSCLLLLTVDYFNNNDWVWVNHATYCWRKKSLRVRHKISIGLLPMEIKFYPVTQQDHGLQKIHQFCTGNQISRILVHTFLSGQTISLDTTNYIKHRPNNHV